MAPVPGSLPLSLSRTDCNAGQVITEPALTLFVRRSALSPPPPWEYSRPDLIAPTLEQLTTHPTVRVRLDGINKMMEFDFMTCDVA